MKNNSSWIITFTLLLTFSTNLAQAEISYLDLKDVDKNIKQEFNEFSFAKVVARLNRELKNRRFFGNYGPKLSKYGCLEQTNIYELLEKNNDCPQDYTSELLQRLFPSQDGINFVANQIPIDFVSKLKPEVIGEILAKIAQFKKQDLSNSEIKKALENNLINEITNILFAGCSPKNYLKTQLKEMGNNTEQYLRIKDKEKSNILNKCVGHGFDTDRSLGLLAMQNDIERTIKVEVQLKQSADKTKEQWKKDDFLKFATLIVNGLNEQTKKDKNSHLVEHSLLAFFLKKSNNKSDILSLFKGMPEVLVNSKILYDGTQEKLDFLASKHDPSEYDPSKIESNPADAANEFIDNPEKMIFSLMQDNLASRVLPPILSYGSAKHSSLGDNKTYPDCGETSLRNFFNIVTYDQANRTFNPKYLEQINGSDTSAHLDLIHFYEKYNDPAEASNQKVHDIWSETVASGLEEVNYLKGKDSNGNPVCEINAGVDNMMKVIDHLLYPRLKGKGPIGGDQWPVEKNQPPSRSDKLDALCKAVSREGFELSWNQKNKDEVNLNNTGVEIEFLINKIPSFKWQFHAGHFAIQDLTSGQDSWKDKIGDEFIKFMNQPNQSNAQKPNKQTIKSLLPLLASKNILRKIPQDSLSDLRENMTYALPLNSNDARLAALEEAQALQGPQRGYIYRKAYQQASS